jgi:hypothetical protein
MVFFEHNFRENLAASIEDRVRYLRQSAPSSGENIRFRNTNGNTAWWRQNSRAHNSLEEIERILLRPVSAPYKNQIFSTFMLVRNVRSIVQPGNNGRTYINRQKLHKNIETDPKLGEAFMQIIYYIDTPKYANGRNANSGNRGQLLLSHNGNTQTFEPVRGHAVYFTPSDTWHEVLPQSNSDKNVNVDRKMIIMMLYKRTNRTNTIAKQIRDYPPGFAHVLSTIAGHIPRPTVRVPNRNQNTLANMLRRTTIQSPSRKRKRPATSENNPRPIKFFKV